jgi:hypothetical protein
MATDVVGSKMASKNGYGQNGYSGASSDTPGQHTTSGFLPQATLPADWGQTRPVSPEQKVPTTKGMRSRNDEGGKIPAVNTRRTRAPLTNRSFQR